MFLKGCETKKKHGQRNRELHRKKKHVDIGSAASKGFVVFCSNVGFQQIHHLAGNWNQQPRQHEYPAEHGENDPTGSTGSSGDHQTPRGHWFHSKPQQVGSMQNWTYFWEGNMEKGVPPLGGPSSKCHRTCIIIEGSENLSVLELLRSTHFRVLQCGAPSYNMFKRYKLVYKPHWP